ADAGSGAAETLTTPPAISRTRRQLDLRARCNPLVGLLPDHAVEADLAGADQHLRFLPRFHQAALDQGLVEASRRRRGCPGHEPSMTTATRNPRRPPAMTSTGVWPRSSRSRSSLSPSAWKRSRSE